jgi:hypothetical protein
LPAPVEDTRTLPAVIAPHPRLAHPDIDEAADVFKPAAPPEVQPRLWISLLVGTGYGWVTGDGDNIAAPVDPSGLAWAQLGHLQPTLGYYLSPTLVVALAGRLQRVTGPTLYNAPAGACGGGHICEGPKMAVAVLGKAMKFSARPSARLRTYYSLALGLGTIRHVATNNHYLGCGSSGAEGCVDSYPAGPVLAGPGAGIVCRIVGGLGLVVGLDLLFAAPHFTFNLDANAGLNFQF